VLEDRAAAMRFRRWLENVATAAASTAK